MPQLHSWLAFILMALVLGIGAITDWHAVVIRKIATGWVPNWLTYPAILAGLTLATGMGAWQAGWDGAVEGMRASGLGLAAGLIPFVIIFAAGGLGGGDVKLMAAVGAISASWQCVLGTAFYGFIVGLIMALMLMIKNRIILRTLLRLFGAMVTFTAGVKPQVESEDSPRVVYALALCLGGWLAGAEHLLGLSLPWSRYLY